MIELAPQNPYGLTLASPLVAVAGALGYGVEVARQLGFTQPAATHGLGAIITRTTTLRAQRARPLPELVETPGGLVAFGTEHNPGLRAIQERFAPIWTSWPQLPIIVSIAAADARELAELAGALELIEAGTIAGVEVSLALSGALDAQSATSFVRAVRQTIMLPLLVNIPIDAADPPGLAQAVIAAGADTLVVGAGPRAAVPGPNGGLRVGRLCGPAVRPLALSTVAAVCAAVDVPVVGVGGVGSAGDAQALLDAGATAVGLDTALLNDLRSAARIEGASSSA
jgi:dihydroorotate dehydrogenase (NAD+) catalytic subunit